MRRIKGEDRLEESSARVEETEAQTTEDRLRRVGVLEETTKQRARLYREHGHDEEADRESADAEALAARRRRIEGRRDQLLDLLGASSPGGPHPRRGR